MLPPDEVASSVNIDASVKDVPRSDERRRLLRGAVAAGPVLMTVVSRPVLGATVCTTASNLGSAGSGALKSAMVCNGLTPSQWKTLAMQWPSPYCATQFAQFGATPTPYHCPLTGFGGNVYGDRTMLEVIDIGEGGTGPTALGRYAVAALLNACSGRTPVLNETAVREMWNNLVDQGFYEPIAGVQWGAEEIMTYLKTTMG